MNRLGLMDHFFNDQFMNRGESTQLFLINYEAPAEWHELVITHKYYLPNHKILFLCTLKYINAK